MMQSFSIVGAILCAAVFGLIIWAIVAVFKKLKRHA